MSFVNAPAGSGKTYRLIDKATGMARRGEQVVIAMPTKKLIEDTIRGEILPRYGAVAHGTIVSGDPERDEDESVLSRVVRKLRQPASGGEILFITHSTLKRIPYTGRLGGWHLIVDEAPQVHECIEIPVGDDRSFLTENVRAAASSTTGYYVLQATSLRTAERLARDHNEPEIRRLGWALTSPNWTVSVHAATFDKLTTSGAEGQRLYAFAQLSPELFKRFESVTIAAANFTDSLAYHLWNHEGVRFVEDLALTGSLRSANDNGAALTIRYAHDGDWSKFLRDKALPGTEQTVMAMVSENVSSLFGTEPFLWVANRDQDDDLFPTSNAVRLPNVAHGLNTFQEFHNVAFLSALNPRPVEFSYFKARGLSEEQVKTAYYWEAVYQTVMRCSLRLPGDKRPKLVVVMDKGSANYLQRLIPGSRTEGLDWIPPEVGRRNKGGRPQTFLNGSDRTAACRARKDKKRLLSELQEVKDRWPSILSSVFGQADTSDWCNVTSIESSRSIVTEHFYGMQFSSVTAAHASDIFLEHSCDHFVKRLRELHGVSVPAKEARALISPAMFQPEKSSTRRGLENIECVRGVWFDNDGGDLTHAQFADLFPGLRIVVFSTFSSTVEQPRWRACIPTSDIMTREVHDAILSDIFAAVEAAGFGPMEDPVNGTRAHGFDTSKKHAASLFYLPCQASDPAGSFFVDYNGEGRALIDPVDWIDRFYTEAAAQPEPQEDLSCLAAPNRCDLKVEAAIESWREVCRMPRVGNKAFFKLGVHLALAGLPERDLVNVLREEAQLARSPLQRLRDIPGIPARLKLYGHL